MAMLFLVGNLGIALLISVTAHTQQQALLTAFLVLMPAVLLSGFIFPIHNMPPIIQMLTYLNPMRWFLQILHGIAIRGVGIQALWPAITFQALLAFLSVTLAVARFKKTLAKGSLKNKFTFLCADASCLAALRKLDISRYAGAFAPCQAGASIPKNVNLFLSEPLASALFYGFNIQAGTQTIGGADKHSRRHFAMLASHCFSHGPAVIQRRPMDRIATDVEFVIL